MAQKLVNNVALMKSGWYILFGCRQKLSGGVNNAWFNYKVTAFDGCLNLHFVPQRNIAKPWQVKINWAFLRTELRWSAKMIHFLGHNSVDYSFRVTVVDKD